MFSGAGGLMAVVLPDGVVLRVPEAGTTLRKRARLLAVVRSSSVALAVIFYASMLARVRTEALRWKLRGRSRRHAAVWEMPGGVAIEKRTDLERRVVYVFVGGDGERGKRADWLAVTWRVQLGWVGLGSAVELGLVE